MPTLQTEKYPLFPLPSSPSRSGNPKVQAALEGFSHLGDGAGSPQHPLDDLRQREAQRGRAKPPADVSQQLYAKQPIDKPHIGLRWAAHIAVTFDERITRQAARRLFATLAWEYWPGRGITGIQHTGARLGLSRDTVKQALKELVRFGHLYRLRRGVYALVVVEKELKSGLLAPPAQQLDIFQNAPSAVRGFVAKRYR